MQIFAKVRGGTALTAGETAKFQSGLLFDLALMDDESGWTQQYHVGAIRNNNSRMFDRLGPDAGYDSIGEEPCAAAGNRFLDRLARAGKLSKTILYNLHPKDTEVLITMAGNFNEGPTVGKVQYGAAWWFLDQEDGMTKQLNALSSLGLLGRFVGMLSRFAQLPLLSAARIFPPYPVQLVGAGCRKRTAAPQRNGVDRPHGGGHFVSQREKLFRVLTDGFYRNEPRTVRIVWQTTAEDDK